MRIIRLIRHGLVDATASAACDRALVATAS
jgi:hypothetical protein